MNCMGFLIVKFNFEDVLEFFDLVNVLATFSKIGLFFQVPQHIFDRHLLDGHFLDGHCLDLLLHGTVFRPVIEWDSI